MTSIGAGVLFELRRNFPMSFSHRNIIEELLRIERKLDILLRHNQIDFSKEDAALNKTTQDINAARERIPQQQTQTKGK